MTKIKVEMSFLRNLQNFENTEIRVGIEDEQRAGEDFDTAYSRIYKKVESELMKAVLEMERELAEESRKAKVKGK